jgi:8-oxo-dGTP pyrophosphatase MutT (NUDIX family)
MQLLIEIFRTEGVSTEGRIIFREAVRAIILNGREVYMIHSPVNGDYKFPGGGVLPGESHEQALRREVREESGRSVRAIEGEFGMVIEYDIPEEPDYDLFKMASYYYLCGLNETLASQNLDDYERDLAFQPEWIDIDCAIEANKIVLASQGEKPLWTRRETFVLELLRERLHSRGKAA